MAHLIAGSITVVMQFARSHGSWWAYLAQVSW